MRKRGEGVYTCPCILFGRGRDEDEEVGELALQTVLWQIGQVVLDVGVVAVADQRCVATESPKAWMVCSQYLIQFCS